MCVCVCVILKECSHTCTHTSYGHTVFIQMEIQFFYHHLRLFYWFLASSFIVVGLCAGLSFGIYGQELTFGVSFLCVCQLIWYFFLILIFFDKCGTHAMQTKEEVEIWMFFSYAPGLWLFSLVCFFFWFNTLRLNYDLRVFAGDEKTRSFRFKCL